MINRILDFYKKRFWNCERYARSIGVKIGHNCSIATKSFGSEPYLIEIGNHVQITNEVKFFNHGAAWVFRDDDPEFDFFGKIKIGNNVYIGNRALILPGVTIGNDVIIGAGSVVAKSVKDNSIVVGNPAKFVGTVSGLRDKMEAFNVSTKKMDRLQKQNYLMQLSDSKFVTKNNLE